MSDTQNTVEEQSEEQVFIDAAMKIIMPAGDARNNAAASLDALLAGDEEKAAELLKEAKKNMLEAHQVQTSLIQKEAQREMTTGTSSKIPLFFIHAQDTIMTIMSEVRLVESMEKMYKAIQSEQ